MKRSFVITCPAAFCFATMVHRCDAPAACRIDPGLLMAQHVGALHPELVYTPAELDRRRLQAQVARRAN